MSLAPDERVHVNELEAGSITTATRQAFIGSHDEVQQKEMRQQVVESSDTIQRPVELGEDMADDANTKAEVDNELTALWSGFKQKERQVSTVHT